MAKLRSEKRDRLPRQRATSNEQRATNEATKGNENAIYSQDSLPSYKQMHLINSLNMDNERNNQATSESNDDIPGTSSSIGSLPQILTRNSYLPSLNNLDAGDVVECYTLMRSAKLENGIMVRKSALAFRFIPKSSSPDVAIKDPFELTLEYGPQRTGATQSFESMPSINGKNRDLDDNGDGMYVSWENHGKLQNLYYIIIIV
jgi:hypothetical protein